jgi:hypothetical protein
MKNGPFKNRSYSTHPSARPESLLRTLQVQRILRNYIKTDIIVVFKNFTQKTVSGESLTNNQGQKSDLYFPTGLFIINI